MTELSGRYPYQVPIDAYGNGGFRFAQMSHRGSLLCLPDGMHAWDVSEPEQVDTERLAQVVAQSDQIDVLLVGTGGRTQLLDPALVQQLRELKIIVEEIDTGGAIRTYNILLGERRAVAAALIAVERQA